MRTHIDGDAERYIAIGETIGETRGLSEGEKAGMAIGIISTARDLGAPDSYILERLVTALDISEEEARQYVESDSGMKRSQETRLRALRTRETARVTQLQRHPNVPRPRS